MVYSYAEGRTVPIQRTLKRGPRGQAAAFNATGMTVELVLRDRNGNEIAEAGTTGWSDASVSLAMFTPASSDLLSSRRKLYARWKVTDGTGAVAIFPGGLEPEEWVIGQ